MESDRIKKRHWTYIFSKGKLRELITRENRPRKRASGIKLLTLLKNQLTTKLKIILSCICTNYLKVYKAKIILKLLNSECNKTGKKEYLNSKSNKIVLKFKLKGYLVVRERPLAYKEEERKIRNTKCKIDTN